MCARVRACLQVSATCSEPGTGYLCLTEWLSWIVSFRKLACLIQVAYGCLRFALIALSVSVGSVLMPPSFILDVGNLQLSS